MIREGRFRFDSTSRNNHRKNYEQDVSFFFTRDLPYKIEYESFLVCDCVRHSGHMAQVALHYIHMLCFSNCRAVA